MFGLLHVYCADCRRFSSRTATMADAPNLSRAHGLVCPVQLRKRDKERLLAQFENGSLLGPLAVVGFA